MNLQSMIRIVAETNTHGESTNNRSSIKRFLAKEMPDMDGNNNPSDYARGFLDGLVWMTDAVYIHGVPTDLDSIVGLYSRGQS